MIEWLEAHDKLAGWAQFAGAILALGLTYFTAFMPVWHRKRQLEASGKRLLQNGYEAMESFHRTFGHFLPLSINLYAASLAMSSVADEISRFPIYELDDQGSRSVARHLIATGVTLSGTRLMLDSMAKDIEGRPATEEERDIIRDFMAEQLKLITNMLSGAELKRPEWPGASQSNPPPTS
ncbi:hypothetical protein [Sphingomonas pituitosa]|uniref:hypothetical protein n=1 Tax=Sphingomonas pituitosa TaxID=99597 RepID=UPI001FE10B19|nr:hypothetical protein [Sphingomonas pituitosa]